MKYVKEFQTTAEYNEYVNGVDFGTPYVYKAKDNSDYHFKKQEECLFAKFKTTSSNEQITIFNGSISSSTFEFIEVDGVKLDSISSPSYTFTTPGNHIVKYKLVDPTTIPANMFAGSKITRIRIPDVTTTIGGGILTGSQIEELIIPDSVTTINGSICNGSSTLKKVVIGGGLETLSISSMFGGCQNIETIILRDGIKTIGDSVFVGLGKLKKIKFSNTLISIGNQVFAGCGALGGLLEIPDSVTNIGDGAFVTCPITDLYIGSGLTTIGSNAFSFLGYLNGSASDYKLKHITVSENNTHLSVIKIGENEALIDTTTNTLIRCTNNNLTEITIPNTITSIADNAFYYCSNLTKVTLPNTITYLSGFNNCNNLIDINIPDSVTSIGNYAFDNCGRLTSIDIPDSVTSIGDHAFAYCGITGNINIPNGITAINDGAFANTNITSINIPSTVTSIGDSAFRDTNITSLILDSTITIGQYAFSACQSLETVVLTNPNNVLSNKVTVINNHAFYNCTSLYSVTLNCAALPTLNGNYHFSNNASNRKFYVPSNQLQNYKMSPGWISYSSDYEAIPTE
mgnify:CR=1 FL=1